MPPSPHDLAILGAGAAGLATALFAAEARPGLRIVVLDGARTIGAKILVSGGGRCNVTNRVVTTHDFHGGSRQTIHRVLQALSVDSTVEWFARLGVPLHEEPLGKLFPDSGRARSVVEALVDGCRHRGVVVAPGHRVTGLEGAAGAFRIASSAGPIAARQVVLATGGQSLPKSGSDGFGYVLAERFGHSRVATTPALVPLVLEGTWHAGLSGISLPVRLALAATGRKRVHVDGALLWTHFGISGPAALDMSRHWLRARLDRRPVSLSCALLPGGFETVERGLLDAQTTRPRLHVGNALGERLPSALGPAICAALDVGPDTTLATLPREARRRLVHALVAWPLEVRDSRGWNHAEVTSGGIALDEIDPATMESRRQPGLYLVGEMLDVDGRLGGFNFQWAWASARVAGKALARAALTSSASGT